MPVEIIPLTKEFYSEWDRFCDRNEEAWFWHTSGWIDYCMKSRFDTVAYNRSFSIVENNNIIAIVPLLIEEPTINGETIKEISFSGGNTPLFIIDKSIIGKKRAGLSAEIWDKIWSIAKNEGIARCLFKLNMQTEAYLRSMTIENNLYKKGFFDTSTYSCILNISQNEDDLMSNMRKGHRAAIKKAQKSLQCICYDITNVDEKVMEEFGKIYFMVAKKATRPDETFKKLHGFVKKGNAVLLKANLGEEIAGYTMVFYYKKYAYYAMACVIEKFKDQDVSHFLQWNAISYLKHHGICYYELGDQFFSKSFFHQVSDKSMSISAFKRGFGGRLVQQISGEYYFSLEYFKKVFQQRMVSFENEIEWIVG